MKKIIIIMISLIFITGCSCSNKSDSEKAKIVEKQMETYVKNFYEKNVQKYINGITQQKVTVAQLKKADYDTSKLTFDGKKCTDESYSLVIIENSNDVANSKYEIEHHLTCGSYKTKN